MSQHANSLLASIDHFYALQVATLLDGRLYDCVCKFDRHRSSLESASLGPSNTNLNSKRYQTSMF